MRFIRCSNDQSDSENNQMQQFSLFQRNKIVNTSKYEYLCLIQSIFFIHSSSLQFIQFISTNYLQFFSFSYIKNENYAIKLENYAYNESAEKNCF